MHYNIKFKADNDFRRCGLILLLYGRLTEPLQKDKKLQYNTVKE